MDSRFRGNDGLRGVDSPFRGNNGLRGVDPRLRGNDGMPDGCMNRRPVIPVKPAPAKAEARRGVAPGQAPPLPRKHVLAEAGIRRARFRLYREGGVSR